MTKSTLASTILASQVQLFKKPKMKIQMEANFPTLMEAPACQEATMEGVQCLMEARGQPIMEVTRLGLGAWAQGHRRCQHPGGGGVCCSSRSRGWGSRCVASLGSPSGAGLVCRVQSSAWSVALIPSLVASYNMCGQFLSAEANHLGLFLWLNSRAEDIF